MASLRHIRTAPYKVRTLYVVVGLPAAAFLYCTRFFSISSFPTTFFGQCKNTIGIPLSTHWLATTRETHTRRVFSHRCPSCARCLPHITANRSSPYHLWPLWDRTFSLHTTTSSLSRTTHHSRHLLLLLRRLLRHLLSRPRNLIPHRFLHRRRH